MAAKKSGSKSGKTNTSATRSRPPAPRPSRSSRPRRVSGGCGAHVARDEPVPARPAHRPAPHRRNRERRRADRRDLPRLQRRAAARGVPAVRRRRCSSTTSRWGSRSPARLRPAGLGMARSSRSSRRGSSTGSSPPARTCTTTRTSASGSRCTAATRRSPTSCCARRASCASTTSSSTTTCCCRTDAFFRKIMRAPEFQRAMSSAEFHCAVRQVRARAREGARASGSKSLLARGVRVRRADLHVVARRLARSA